MIYLLCSTIRPEVFKPTHKVWMDNCMYPEQIRTKVVVDSKLHHDLLLNYDCMLYTGDSVGITKPLTALTMSLSNLNLNDDDIIVVMSDDFFPPKDWDEFLIAECQNFKGALNVYDGGPPEVQASIITIPIMTYACLKRLNHIIYHPAYTHMYSDNELFDVLTELKLLKTTDKSSNHTFEHRHWTTGKRKKDDVDVSLGELNYKTDQDTYNHRKRLSRNRKLKTDFNPNSKLLSILICTLDERRDQLSELMRLLSPQLTDEVEVVVLSDNRISTIGKKRDKLLKIASGKYVCFVDDDDAISDDYVRKILNATEYNADCIGMRGTLYISGKPPKDFIHSIRNKEWHETKDAYFRSPNHLNPIKRSLAIQIGFDSKMGFGEDYEFSKRIAPLLKTECYISTVIYKYIFRPLKEK